tara:strand:+ start:72 stop:311 length:240 start_codon:yes stop_codon:yes gene_type:complete
MNLQAARSVFVYFIWLVALIIHTGVRLSGAAGLKFDEKNLKAPLPLPHPHRRLKTASSERKIPLIGYITLGCKTSLKAL